MPPAAAPHSALTLRLILAGFGLVVCSAGTALFLTLAWLPVLAGLLALAGLAAALDLVVITRRRRGNTKR